MMTAPLQEITHDAVVHLIDICQDGEVLYSIAARGTTDPMLRAEFTQYSAQRREFVVELYEAIHEAGDDLHETVRPIAEPSSNETLRRAVSDFDHTAILAECERAEALAVEGYRQAVAAGLPYVVGGVVHSQFIALARVHDRIQLLAAAALEAQG